MTHENQSHDIEASLARPVAPGYEVEIQVILGLDGSHRTALLSTRHPASSYGLPVVLADGRAYGPLDLADGSELLLTPWFAASARAAGYAVREVPSNPEIAQY